MTTNKIKCKYCNSEAVTKFGTYHGDQRYWCKICQRKFTDNDTLPKMKTDKRIIASALSCYYGGMPLDAIQRHLQQQYGIYFSESGIYNWVIRFSKLAVERTKDFKPEVGDTWIADETMLKVGGENIWYWDIIDAKTRYLLASYVSKGRTTQDAEMLMHKALQRADKMPKKIITDKLASYLDGIELVFGNNTQHVQSSPFKSGTSTQIIERFHGTLKDRTNVVRGFKNMDTARTLTDAWLVHYNFFKEHESMGNIPPAQLMPNAPIGDWMDVIEGKERTRKFIATAIPAKRKNPPYRNRGKHKRRRKPREVREKPYSVARLTQVRG